MTEKLWLFFLIKHFVCDYPLQACPWQYRNKGTYGHPCGIVHAGLHGLATFLGLFILRPEYALALALADFAVHYHIDWAKMNIGRRFNLLPTNGEMFWQVLGLDQLLHYLTYFAIIHYSIKWSSL